MERGDNILLALYEATRLIAKAAGVPEGDLAALPDFPLLGSGWLDDIADAEKSRLMKQGDILKMTGEGALKYSLLNPD